MKKEVVMLGDTFESYYASLVIAFESELPSAHC